MEFVKTKTNMGMTLLDLRNTNDVSLLEYTLNTRVMAGLCIIGEVLTFIVPPEEYPDVMLFFVMMLGVVFWKGVYDDAIRLLEARVESNRQDQRFFALVGLFDTLLLFASLPLLWRLPAYGTILYVIITLPVGVVVVYLSLRRLYHTYQRVRLSRY